MVVQDSTLSVRGFLLVVFFVLVCQYIVAENFPVTMPDKCQFAENNQQNDNISTVTVMKTKVTDIARYAVGSEMITAQKPEHIAAKIADLTDARLEADSRRESVVCLRVDKDVPLSYVQYALAGIAQIGTAEIKLAVFRQDQIADD